MIIIPRWTDMKHSPIFTAKILMYVVKNDRSITVSLIKDGTDALHLFYSCPQQVLDHRKTLLLGFDFADSSTTTMFLSVKTHANRGTNKIQVKATKLTTCHAFFMLIIMK